jgi:hypothetical protein
LWSGVSDKTHYKFGEPESIRTLAHPVAWRVVVADPDFAARIAGDGAAYFVSAAPNDLGVMATDARTGVGAVGVVAGFRGPIANNFGRQGSAASDLKEIFAKSRMRAMIKLLLLQQTVGPLLSAGGQAI